MCNTYSILCTYIHVYMQTTYASMPTFMHKLWMCDWTFKYLSGWDSDLYLRLVKYYRWVTHLSKSLEWSKNIWSVFPDLKTSHFPLKLWESICVWTCTQSRYTIFRSVWNWGNSGETLVDSGWCLFCNLKFSWDYKTIASFLFFFSSLQHLPYILPLAFIQPQGFLFFNCW